MSSRAIVRSTVAGHARFLGAVGGMRRASNIPIGPSRWVEGSKAGPLGKFSESANQHAMRSSRPPISMLLVACVAALVCAASSATAQTTNDLTRDQVPGRDDRSAVAQMWIPSVSLSFAGLPEDRSAKAFSDTSGFQDGDSVGFPWSVGGDLELASPVIYSHRLKPRLWVHAGAGGVFDSEDPVTSVGEPGSPPLESSFQSVPEAIENVGSAVRVQAKNWILNGGVGVQFELEALDRTVTLRPTLEWTYRRDEIRGILGGGEAESLTPAGLCDPCRTLFIKTETEKGYHSLGGGLEAEVDGTRIGDFELRFFLSGRFYRVLGDRKTELSPSGSWVRSDGLPTSRPDTVFDIEYERDPWHYRFGVGLRLLLAPEE